MDLTPTDTVPTSKPNGKIFHSLKRIVALLIVAAVSVVLTLLLVSQEVITVPTPSPETTPDTQTTNQTSETENQASKVPEVKVIPQVVPNLDSAYRVNVIYPMLVDLDNKEFQLAFTEASRNIINKHVESFSAQAVEENLLSFLPWIEITYDYFFPSADTISVLFKGTMAPGDVPYALSFYEVLLFDLDEGKEITVSSTFKPESNYLEVVASKAYEQINGAFSMSKYGPLLSEERMRAITSPTPENYAGMYLTETELRIAFSAEQLGPYAGNSKVVIIPYTELSDILN